jgi:hypothetical protein
MCNVGALNPVKSCSIIFNKNHWMGANFWIFSPWYFWQPLTHPMEAARRTHGNAHIGPYIMGGLICSQGHFVWIHVLLILGIYSWKLSNLLTQLSIPLCWIIAKIVSPRLFLLEYKKYCWGKWWSVNYQILFCTRYMDFFELVQGVRVFQI